MFKQNIYCFIEVVETGSFTSASKKLLMSQSAVSQQIDKLEKELGVKLFDRSFYRPQLTKVGQYYYESLKDIIRRYETLEKEIKKKDQKQYIMGITSIFEKKHIPNIIKRIKEQYNIQIQLKYSDLKHCKEELLNHHIDIAFGLVNDFKDEIDIYYEDIYPAHICLICSEDHPFSQLDSIDIKDIEDENIIVLSRNLGEGFYHDFMEAFSKDHIKPKIYKEVDTQEDLIMSVRLNEGIAFSAKEVIGEDDPIHIIDIKNTHHQAHYAIGYYQKNEDMEHIIKEIKDYFKTL